MEVSLSITYLLLDTTECIFCSSKIEREKTTYTFLVLSPGIPLASVTTAVSSVFAALDRGAIRSSDICRFITLKSYFMFLISYDIQYLYTSIHQNTAYTLKYTLLTHVNFTSKLRYKRYWSTQRRRHKLSGWLEFEAVTLGLIT